MTMLKAIETRYSPMFFDQNRELADQDISLIFEAGRWAPSSFNEQPWRYIRATRNNTTQFGEIVSLLIDYNQQWAFSAAMLVVVVASDNLELNGKPNKHAWYDTGLSAGQMVVQANALGIQAHQMGGFDAGLARRKLNIPEGFTPVCVIAFGYPAAIDQVPEMFQERAREQRIRKPLSEIVFDARFIAS